MKKENEFLNKDNIVAIIGIIFFIVLVIIVRVNPEKEQGTEPTPSATPTPTTTSTPEPEESEQEEKPTSVFDLIDTKNYHYIYNVTNNEEIEVIEGEKNSNKEIFSIIGKQKQQYAKVGDSYLKYQNGNYQTTTGEIRNYLPYINIDSMKEILSISRAKEEDDKIIFTIDTTDLLDKYTEIEYSGFEKFKDDSVIVYLNEEEQVYKIELDYSNYFTYVKNNNTIFKVTMEFDKFGLIEELEL